jgi:hypothetical protein
MLTTLTVFETFLTFGLDKCYHIGEIELINANGYYNGIFYVDVMSFAQIDK